VTAYGENLMTADTTRQSRRRPAWFCHRKSARTSAVAGSTPALGTEAKLSRLGEWVDQHAPSRTSFAFARLIERLGLVVRPQLWQMDSADGR
jgi:hypothetical protein